MCKMKQSHHHRFLAHWYNFALSKEFLRFGIYLMITLTQTVKWIKNIKEVWWNREMPYENDNFNTRKKTNKNSIEPQLILIIVQTNTVVFLSNLEIRKVINIFINTISLYIYEGVRRSGLGTYIKNK